MRLVDGLQSAIMYRTGKPLHGRANVFVLHPLIIIYVVSTTLLLGPEGAQASASQSDIEEAEKTVGQFLRNETGSKWLASLAKSRSAPLTTPELMKELRKATRPDGRVWRASMTLSDSFDEQTRKGIKTVSILGQAENWKAILEHIEEQDDIICLYRKSTGETAKKADDWKKFLRTITPGYTVHLAVDTGSKYVICLKKLELPESTPAEVSSTQETPSTVATSEVSPAATSVTPSAITSEKIDTTPTLEILKNTKNESHVKLVLNDENCHDETSDGSEDCRDEESNSREDIADKVFEEESRKIPKPGMEDDLNEGYEKYPANFTHERRGMYPPLAKRRQLHPPNKASSESSHDPDCNRPIILVMQNGDAPLGYLPGRLSEFSTQRHFGAAKIPWIQPAPAVRVPYPQPAKIPTINNMPRHIVYPPKTPVRPNRYFVPPNKFPRLPRPNNPYRPMVDVRTTVHTSGPQQVLSHNSQVVYHPPRGKVQRPIVKYNSQAGAQIARHPVRPVARPVAQRASNPLVRQPPRIKSQDSQSDQPDPFFVNSMRYPFGSYSPRRVQGPVRPVARPVAQRASNPLVRQPPRIKSQDSQSDQPDPFFVNSMRYPFGSYSPRRVQGQPGPIFPNSMIHGRVENTQRKVPARNIPNEANMGQSIRQFVQRYQNPRTSPRASVSGPAASVIRKPISNLYNIGEPRYLPRSSLQGIPQNSLQMYKLLRQNPTVIPKVYQRPSFVLNPNYPTPNYLERPVRPCPIPWNPPCPINLVHPLERCDNPLVCPLTGNPLQHNSVPCQIPCDKPVKLQIVINGKVQEPLKVSVISEPGQRVEIVGFGRPVMPHGSRALRGKAPFDSGSGGIKKHVDPEVLEIKERIFESNEDTKKYVDDEEEGNQKNKEKKNKVDESVSSGGNATDISGKLDDKNNSTTELKVEVTTESSKGLEIEQRFLHEGTTEKTSTVSTTVANTTLSTTTNSTTTNSTTVE